MSKFTRVRGVAAIAALSAAAVLPVASTTASAASDQPNVHVQATRFDKYVYAPGDSAVVVFTLRNIGPVDAKNVKIVSGGSGDSSELDVTDWGGVGHLDEGITITAGQTVPAKLRGTVPEGSFTAGNVAFSGGFSASNGESDDTNNYANARASVPGGKGTLTGLSYVDGNQNGRKDPGEGLANVRVTVVGLYDIELVTSATTDANGEFVIPDLPAGVYETRVRTPEGWWLKYGDPVSNAGVRAGERSTVVYEAEPRI
ncbi:carboxypeptidase-like regulatory domain-containing protein [Kibdelosporangium phytohabitans]|uniref:SD-repeat containing protein B domain-containing protein n=1 Tax=Kibdelosporangium phytohabitans TaxID=860235 RepID=A0A0N7F5H7_9PSEU|nr:carboxypeptidase-like regulatory domain-containing protein [Kibdelosporangium phytohabitans]ALG14263.1 hypothetical protein AOZ06_51935 [Kibdelosporangium phytohabitans]MBE1466730.1 hypothetical protein [Kibdelosporangium phytohabitans]